MWGCFVVGKEVHVIPCDKNSNIGVHVLELDCFCHPHKDAVQENLIIHEESVN